MSHKKKEGISEARPDRQTKQTQVPNETMLRDLSSPEIQQHYRSALNHGKSSIWLLIPGIFIFQTLKIATSRMRLRKTYLYATEILVGARIRRYLADRS